jgi:hypothetical protein
LSYVPDDQPSTILDSQNILAWPARVFTKQEPYTTNASISFDTAKLGEMVNSWPFMSEQNMKPPVDAHVEFKPPSYVVVEEYNGTTLDKDKAAAAVAGAVRHLQSDLLLSDTDCYQKPAVTKDDAQLKQQIDLYNKYVPFSVTYTFGDATEVLDGRTAINWVDTTAEPTGELNHDAVAAWVADFAARHNTLGTERRIKNGFGEEKVVEREWEFEGGTYGWVIDQTAEVVAIMDAARNHKGDVREPFYSQRAAAFGPEDWGRTYVECDITAQHMWYFRDGELIAESDVVTGQPINDRETPTGVFYIIEMSSPKRMKGDGWAGVAPWDETVNYYMGFTEQGHGFHDGLWRNAFGGNIWINNGSHGCINMPLGPATTLWENLEMGTPVVVHM